MTQDVTRADPMSRAALKQMLWLGFLGTLGFVVLMVVLGWATSMTGGGAASQGGIDFEARAITTTIRDEPPQLDSTRATDTYSSLILGHVMEGLLRYDENDRLVAGVAERWDVRTDGATFWLREDAVWSDGKPVTAHDFVFAWQTGVDPATASRYAFILYVLKNGEAINKGELPRDALGARAISNRELEVEFERPVAYFDKLVAFKTYNPVREDFYLSRDGRYGADPEDLLYNGPFEITRWVHGSQLRMEKNPLYWDSDSIWLNVIDIGYMTGDANARLNLFQDGRIADVDHLPAEALGQALQQRWPLGRYSDGSVWFLQFNHRPERLTSNFHLRKAIQLVNDNRELVYKVLKIPSFTPADSLFPAWLKGENSLLRQEYPAPTVTPDIAAARAHLELAKRELGVDELPPIVLLSDDQPIAAKHGEYFQNLLMRTLDIEVRLDKQIFKQRLAKAEDGEFDIVLYGWAPDYDDPLTFGDLFASWNLNNHGEFDNAELDAQVQIAQESTDIHERMLAFGEIQRIMFEEVTIVPFYERGVMYVQDPRLKGVRRRAIGTDPDYTNAYLVENP